MSGGLSWHQRPRAAAKKSVRKNEWFVSIALIPNILL
jgi:hypothetical protein